MAEDLMRYDLLAQDALKGVVRQALRRVAKTGLPGEHHFYVSFDTRSPGVRLSERLRRQYPKEMTVVLQHQFWGLEVTEDRFVVELSFDNIPEKLTVPFAAVKGFFDPAVQFGLQFETIEANENVDPREASDERTDPETGDEAVAGEAVAEANSAAEAAAGEAAESETPKVIQLDTFRKKQS